MNKLIIIIMFCLAFPFHGLCDTCRDWDILDKIIRDNKISVLDAKIKITDLNRNLFSEYKNSIKHTKYYFPVEYSTSRDMGDRKGFITRGYDFYDGNKHKAHPAYDIFILDKNQDSVQDITGKPVSVFAFTAGIVTAINDKWEIDSEIRGGKYIWIYSPVFQRYYYYAHLNEVSVKPGDIVTAGRKIGCLGRTGKNAFLERSPTHLHFMIIDFKNAEMKPFDGYQDLGKSESSVVINEQKKDYPWLTESHEILRRIKDIPCPEGFNRPEQSPESFAYWLRNLPLKPPGAFVYLHDGRKKNRQDAHYAVLDIDTGSKDLQQCADAVMRLRAEYLFSKNRYDEISFNFVNLFKAEYSKWLRGNFIAEKGNKTVWVKTNTDQSGYKSFRKYLNTVFSYANTYSLSKEMKSVTNLADIKVGDVFIQGGFPGHAVIVVDSARDKSGRIVFLLAQSYMPAQDIHILKSPFEKSPWYDLEFGQTLQTPEWNFNRNDLKRW